MNNQYSSQTRTASNGGSGLSNLMSKCSHCGKEVYRTFWTRLFPDAMFCKECWALPDEDKIAIIRSTIAHTLVETRKRSRSVAFIMRDSMRGTGVPPNPKRRKPS